MTSDQSWLRTILHFLLITNPFNTSSCLSHTVSDSVLDTISLRLSEYRNTLIEVKLFVERWKWIYSDINSQLPKLPITPDESPVNALRLLIKFLIFPVLGCVWYLWTIAIIATKLIENVSNFSFLIQNILLHEVILNQCKQGITVSTAYRCNNIHLFHRNANRV